MPLFRLEPYGSKDPRTVLRGLCAGNRAWLPDIAYDGVQTIITILWQLSEMAIIIFTCMAAHDFQSERKIYRFE
jgi:hypothetical protein